MLLHGLTATRRYVVMGSTALERAGHRVVAYDARGHGRSGAGARRRTPTATTTSPPTCRACSTTRGIERAVLAGASMGAHTALRLALEQPERVAGLVVITPAYDPATHGDAARSRAGTRSRTGCAPAASRASSRPTATAGVPEPWRETVLTVLRQRLARARAPGRGRRRAARGAALAAVRRRSHDARGDRGARRSSSPTATRPTPAIRCAVGEAYAAAIPGARLVVEEPGKSPIAWQGGQLSKVIAEVASEAEA